MSRELRIKHDPSDTPQNYTAKMEREFEARGLDMHRHEVEKLEDDFGSKERVLRVKNTKYFVIGGSK